MKIIEYRGGLITFSIPRDWQEEYEADGGGAFYEDVPNSGTLRVNVLTLAAKTTNDHPSETFRELWKSETLTESKNAFGDDIFEYFTRTVEDTVPILLFNMNCIHATRQSDYLIALFTWTIEARFENTQAFNKEIEMVRQIVNGVKYCR